MRVFHLKCESKMLVLFFFNTMLFNCISFFLICNLSSEFDKQEPVSYGISAVIFFSFIEYLCSLL